MGGTDDDRPGDRDRGTDDPEPKERARRRRRDRRLLVPVDDSEPARAALEHAVSLFPEADVTVLHAVDDLEAHYGGGQPAGSEGASSGSAGGDATASAFLEDAERIAAEYGASVETTVVEGTPVEAIVEYAEREGVDGIVMGSEGRAGVSRMLLGSVAEGVARRSPVPVTIVR